MNKQVIFMDNEGNVQAGIWNQDRNEIICGCCGATIESGDFVLLHIYDEWRKESATLIISRNTFFV